MVYSWATYGFSVDPNIVGKEFEKIEAECGEVTSRNVLQRAKDESNPMHPLFEWDDSVAANNYRLHQASVLICNLKAEVQNDTKPKTVRAYFNVSDDEKQGKFINVNAAFENPDTKDIVLKRALRELQTFQKKYETLSEFSMLFEQINQIALMLKKEG